MVMIMVMVRIMVLMLRMMVAMVKIMRIMMVVINDNVQNECNQFVGTTTLLSRLALMQMSF